MTQDTKSTRERANAGDEKSSRKVEARLTEQRAVVRRAREYITLLSTNHNHSLLTLHKPWGSRLRNEYRVFLV